MTLFADPFFMHLLIFSISSSVLIRFCYYTFSQQRSHAAAFLLFGMGVFLVTSQLHSADVSMGFAFGLFAVFSMLRYRTESMNIKEMTYLFLTIAMALLCAVSDMDAVKLASICGFMCALAYGLEINLIFPLYQEREVTYEKIENLNADNKEALYEDLKARTGLNIHHVQIVSMDFMRDSALLKLHYSPNPEPEPEPESHSSTQGKQENKGSSNIEDKSNTDKTSDTLSDAVQPISYKN